MRKNRPARVPGMQATQSHRIPRCSVDAAHAVQRNEVGEWFCVTCADDFIGEYLDAQFGHLSQGGVELPSGVRDERKEPVTVKRLMPNRKARRRMRAR